MNVNQQDVKSCNMDNIEEKIEEAYDGWREIWDLDDMTPREIYDAGFRHGVEAAEKQRDELLDMLDTLCNGIAWNIEHHPDVMNESDSEALQSARLLLEKLRATA